jgi:hypothetical protein
MFRTLIIAPAGGHQRDWRGYGLRGRDETGGGAASRPRLHEKHTAQELAVGVAAYGSETPPAGVTRPHRPTSIHAVLQVAKPFWSRFSSQ